MKKSLITIVASCALALFVVGCGSEEKLDSSKLQSEFASTSGEIKASADKAVAAINAGNINEAITALDVLISHSNDLSQAQIDAATEAFVVANVVVFEKGDAESAAQAKSKADELKAQAKGSE